MKLFLYFIKAISPLLHSFKKKYEFYLIFLYLLKNEESINVAQSKGNNLVTILSLIFL